MKNYYDSSRPKDEPYKPEKINHVRTAVKTLFFMLVYHAISWLIYDLFIGTSVIQMMRDELFLRARWTMFGFSLICLLVIASVLAVFYLKNGDRKRAFLAATSMEVRGSTEGVSEGTARYRKLAFKEAWICTLSTGALWIIPAIFYTISLSMAGIGFGYDGAWGLEKFFVSFAGLCEPFQSPWIGLLIGMAILFVFHYFGRLYAHQQWEKNRIRR